MFGLVVHNIGPVARAELRLGRVNIMYGEAGSGKSMIFRILKLLELTVRLQSVIEQDPATLSARLVLLDANLRRFVDIRPDLAKRLAVSAILKVW